MTKFPHSQMQTIAMVAEIIMNQNDVGICQMIMKIFNLVKPLSTPFLLLSISTLG